MEARREDLARRAALAGDEYVVLAGVRNDRVLIKRATAPAAEAWPRGAFEARWRGRLILVARRATYPKALMIPYQKGER